MRWIGSQDLSVLYVRSFTTICRRGCPADENRPFVIRCMRNKVHSFNSILGFLVQVGKVIRPKFRPPRVPIALPTPKSDIDIRHHSNPR